MPMRRAAMGQHLVPPTFHKINTSWCRSQAGTRHPNITKNSGDRCRFRSVKKAAQLQDQLLPSRLISGLVVCGIFIQLQ
ncbi:hypothetical protein RRG08_022819 [Elysia crispata]|uniref:Uncharacterized protein n=1 Tax=Elysia crispata TaxID=231223 RepID=A0AAE0Z087_9GAST|nr:hypothetical protein RRG08_022819 [Elysia crispata]